MIGRKSENIFLLVVIAVFVFVAESIAASAVAVGSSGAIGVSFNDNSLLMAEINAKEDCRSSRKTRPSCYIIKRCSRGGRGAMVKSRDDSEKIDVSCGKDTLEIAIKEARAMASCFEESCIVVKKWDDIRQ